MWCPFIGRKSQQNFFLSLVRHPRTETSSNRSVFNCRSGCSSCWLAPWITTAVVIAIPLFWAVCSDATVIVVPGYSTLQFNLATPALPPIGHTWFCVVYPDDCKAQGIDFRRRNIRLTPQRWNELNVVNREVNQNITPENTERPIGSLLPQQATVRVMPLPSDISFWGAVGHPVCCSLPR
jgi:Bacterial transglutaminase-like cysteine proteinase BTLCP